MGKKKKDRNVSRLRAEVEFLKAQLKTAAPEPRGGGREPERVTGLNTPVNDFSGADRRQGTVPSYQVNAGDLKNDLIRTFTLTGLALAVLLGAAFTEPYWPVIGQALITAWPKQLPGIK